MKILTALVLAVVVIAGCYDAPATNQKPEESEDHRLLRQQGYKDIVLKGFVPFKCSDGDNMFLLMLLKLLQLAAITLAVLYAEPCLKARPLGWIERYENGSGTGESG